MQKTIDTFNQHLKKPVSFEIASNETARKIGGYAGAILMVFLALTSGTLAHAKYQQFSPKIATPPKIVHVGKASWYSENDPGINFRTANNEIFDDQAMTCAMWDVPFNQLVKVTNRSNGKFIIVRVNDRGPHHRYFRKGRIVDLTKTAFEKLSSSKKGLIDIEVEFL